MAVKRFPYGTFRVIGVLQIILGILFLCQGSAHYGLEMADGFLDHSVRDHLPPITGNPVVTFAAMAVGTLVILTGGTAVCMTKNKREYLASLKVSFLTLSILNAVSLAPVMIHLYVNAAIIEHAIRIIRKEKELQDAWIEFAVFAILAFVQFLLSIISTALCCCRSPLPCVVDEMEVPLVMDRKPEQNGGRYIDQGDYENPCCVIPPYETGYNAGQTDITKLFIQSP